MTSRAPRGSPPERDDRGVNETGAPHETAYYYPEPYWLADEGGWIKSLLLFFDEVAILLPSYMRGRNLLADPTLAAPLADQGLLRVLEPESFLDAASAERLVEVVTALVTGGAFDELSDAAHFAEISMSRMGYGVMHEVSHALYEMLAERGLATDTRDGVSIPMHPIVRSVYLIVIAQLSREVGQRAGLDLHPVTNGRAATDAFERFLELAPMPSRGHVVGMDLEVVGIDLETVPLDDVLSYRRENADAHRRYMQNLRAFALDLSLMEAPDRRRALADRRADLADEARDLRSRASSAWKSPKDVAGFGLGLTGAAWSVMTGNPVPAALGALGAGLRMLPSRATGSAYSYLFRARRELP